MSKNRSGRPGSPSPKQERDKRPRLSTPSGSRSLLDDKDDPPDNGRSACASTSAVAPPFAQPGSLQSLFPDRSPPSPHHKRTITSPSVTLSNLINAPGPSSSLSLDRPSLPPLTTKRPSEASTAAREFYPARSPASASSSHRREQLPVLGQVVRMPYGHMQPFDSPPRSAHGMASTALPQAPAPHHHRSAQFDTRTAARSSIHSETPFTSAPAQPPLQPAVRSEAWFALGRARSPPHLDSWPRDRAEAYRMGFEDALARMEAGVVGVGGLQYRHPLLVSRDIPPEIPHSSGSGLAARVPAPTSPPRPPIHAHGPGPWGEHHPSTRPYTYSPHQHRPLSVLSPYPTPSAPSTAGGGNEGPPPPHTRSQSFSAVLTSSQSFSFGGVLPASSSSTSTSTTMSRAGRTGGTGPHIVHPPPATYDLQLARSSSSSSSAQFGSFSLDPASSSAGGGGTGAGAGQGQGYGQGGSGRRGTRQLISCFPCRKKKLRCDGETPCGQCVRRKPAEECTYAPRVRRRGKGRRREEGEEGSSEADDASASGGVRGDAGALEGRDTTGGEGGQQGSASGSAEGSGARDAAKQDESGGGSGG